MAIFFAACSGNKSPHSLQQEKEDLSAKGLLQGIWLDDETESPLMRVEGDTISTMQMYKVLPLHLK